MGTKSIIIDAINTALEKVGIKEKIESLEWPANPSFGDYSSNISLRLAKQYGKSPIELAESIKGQVSENEVIKKIEVVAPGFINIWLQDQVLQKELQEILTRKNTYGSSQVKEGKKVIIEYTDPNPFKELHIGHLYSNAIGESLARLHEFMGAEVKRANYQGDVGMHVAKALWGLEKKMEQDNESLESLSQKPLAEIAKYMGEAYALGSQKFEEDEQIKEEMKQLNKKIYQQTDEHINELYKKGREWSLAYFETIYKRLGTNFDLYFFESEVGKVGVELVKKNIGSVFKESQGAIVYEGESEGLHTRVFINSLGLPTYEAKDLALPSLKYEKFPYDISIIVTGNEIDEYFKVILAVLTKINPELAKKTKHLSHAMVRLPEGKMSSRKGNVLTAEWLLDETKKKIKEIIQTNSKLDPNAVEETCDTVSVASVKYSLLRSSIGKDVIFDFDESLSFDGNSGPYLQYTYARCKSILEKNNEETTAFTLTETELPLLRLLVKFPEVVESASNHTSPSAVATYLYTLAQTYNTFYQKAPILKAEGEMRSTRLALTHATSHILQTGLHLLGIETVEKM